MTNTKNGSIYKAVIAVLLTIALIFTGAWAVEDRINRKIDSIRAQYSSDSICIREMKETLARIEERQKYILKRLDDKNK